MRRSLHSALSGAFIAIAATGGVVDGWVAVVIDIHERRRQEEALRTADRRKDNFIATLAHELRNPLGAIRNAAQILVMRESVDPELGWCPGVIERQSRQMARLLDDLLDVSRISQDQMLLRKKRIELRRILEAAVETSRPIVERGAHELSVTLPPDSVCVEGDPLRLEQILTNLIHNAARYTDVGGLIRVDAEQSGREAIVTVRDTGIGIPADAMPHLFTAFSHQSTTLERSRGGLGIGLALAKRLVELHGGSIRVRSGGKGKGSEFEVRLPLSERAALSQAPAGERAREWCAPLRLVVADDERDGADTLAHLLRLQGHHVVIAYDGEQAFVTAERVRPDAALLDIGMPNQNGYDVCRRIRGTAWGSEIFLIALTGWAQEEDRRRAREAGFNRHLTKPVSSEALLDLLASIPSGAAR